MADVRQTYLYRLNSKLASIATALFPFTKQAQESANDAWIKSNLPEVTLRELLEHAESIIDVPDVMRNMLAMHFMQKGYVKSIDDKIPFDAIRDIINFLKRAERYDGLLLFAELLNKKQPVDLNMTVGELANELEASVKELSQLLPQDEHARLVSALNPYIATLRSLPKDTKASLGHVLVGQLLARPHVSQYTDKIDASKLSERAPNLSLAPGFTQKGVQEVKDKRTEQQPAAGQQQPGAAQQQAANAPAQTIPPHIKVLQQPVKGLAPAVYKDETTGRTFVVTGRGKVVPVQETTHERLANAAKKHQEAINYYRQVMNTKDYKDDTKVNDTAYGKVTEDALKIADQWSESYNWRGLGYDTFWDKADIIGIARRHFAKQDESGNQYVDGHSVRAAIGLLRLLQIQNSLGHEARHGPKGKASVENLVARLKSIYSPEEWDKIKEAYNQITNRGTKALNDYDIMVYGRSAAYQEASKDVDELFPGGKFGPEHDWRRKAWEERQQRPTPLPFGDKARGRQYDEANRVPIDPRIAERRRVIGFLRGQRESLSDEGPAAQSRPAQPLASQSYTTPPDRSSSVFLLPENPTKQDMADYLAYVTKQRFANQGRGRFTPEFESVVSKLVSDYYLGKIEYGDVVRALLESGMGGNMDYVHRVARAIISGDVPNIPGKLSEGFNQIHSSLKRLSEGYRPLAPENVQPTPAFDYRSTYFAGGSQPPPAATQEVPPLVRTLSSGPSKVPPKTQTAPQVNPPGQDIAQSGKRNDSSGRTAIPLTGVETNLTT